MEGNKSQAPWVDNRDYWGRIRLTHRMWEATYRALRAYLNARWVYHNSLPNPSEEGRRSLDEIREIQKVVHNLEGLAEEKGWDLPTTSSNGSSHPG